MIKMKSLDLREKVYSFDVFDTLITRKIAEPSGIHKIVQEQIKNFDIPEVLKNNYARIRHETESYCQERNLNLYNKFDCTIHEIFEFIKKNYLLSDEITEQIKQTEIQEEIKNAFPIYENINKLKNLINKNQKVVLISDKYLTSDIIRKILVNIDPVFADIEIYTSSDTGKKKANGTLYKFVQEKYNIITHIGDNTFSDITEAKWNGIKPILYKFKNFKPYEKIALQKNHFNIFVQKSIGISRALRQNSTAGKSFEFAVSYTAPIIYSYTDWVLKEANRRNIKSLYFVARDGYIPKIIADIIIRNKKYKIQTHYFYCSRRACRYDDEKNINEEKRKLYFKYVKQNINFQEKFGFVDLNGSGKTLDLLAEFINKNKACVIDTFYFRFQGDMQYCDKTNKVGFLNSLNYNVLILELLCRTLHGQTIGYEEKAGKIYPILEYEKNLHLEKWGYNEYLKGIEMYSKIMSQEECESTELCIEYLKYMKGLIDKETADLIGTIPFSQWGDEINVKEFIPPYTIFNLFSNKSFFKNISSSRAKLIIKYLSIILNKKNFGYISKKQNLAYLKIGKFKFDISRFVFK